MHLVLPKGIPISYVEAKLYTALYHNKEDGIENCVEQFIKDNKYNREKYIALKGSLKRKGLCRPNGFIYRKREVEFLYFPKALGRAKMHIKTLRLYELLTKQLSYDDWSELEEFGKKRKVLGCNPAALKSNLAKLVELNIIEVNRSNHRSKFRLVDTGE